MSALGPIIAKPNLTALGARELAREISARRVSATEALDAYVQRIESTEDRVHAVVAERYAAAEEEAEALDLAVDRGEIKGPLHGVPISVKESFDVAGLPTTGGLPGRRGHRAEADAPLVAALKQAGAIVIAKTNVPQLLLSLESDNPLYGLTRNPWDPDRTPGGSSGGEAALVASGGSALGLGTDLGGSLRVPAHYCGVHTIKPTSRRLTLAGTFDSLLGPGQDTLIPSPGPIARRVEDLALALEVLGSAGAADSALPPVPWRNPLAVAIEGLRVGTFVDDGWFDSSPGLHRVVREAADALEAAGAHVEHFDLPDVEEAMAVYFGLLSAAGGGWARQLLGADPVDRRLADLVRLASLPARLTPALAAVLSLAGQPLLARTVRSFGRRSAGQFQELSARRDRYRDRFLSADSFGRFDALLCPPAPTPALRHGASRLLNSVASYTMLINLVDLPAGVVSLSRVRAGEESDRVAGADLVRRAALRTEEGSDGLPLGVQVVAHPWREDVVLAVMASLEQAFRDRPDYPAAPPL